MFRNPSVHLQEDGCICSYGTVMLPEFQVQVLICTGDSGSNPERALYRYILLVVND